MTEPSNDRPYDLLVYGATGLTGRHAAQFLARHAPPSLRLAIGGRRREALEAIAAGLGRPCGVLVAEASDRAAVEAMVGATRVVLSTTGPFARYGDEIVAAAVRKGAHYADITGETPWVRAMIDRWQVEAVQAGVVLVPFSGFDSVPSDLGAWLLAEAARERGTSLGRVQGAFAMRGGLNGGTLASLLALAEDDAMKTVEDPWLLSPPDAPRRPELAPETKRPRWDPRFERWLTPFVMAGVNTRVVRRSAALAHAAGRSYGEGFAYDEALETRSRVQAVGWSLGIGLFPTLVRSERFRAWLKHFGPKPGEGPTEAQMDAGWFRARFWAETADRRLLFARVEDQGDAGNRGTVKMLCAVGLGLAAGEAKGAGFLTPATALGGALVDRLRGLGMTLEVGDGLTPAKA